MKKDCVHTVRSTIWKRLSIAIICMASVVALSAQAATLSSGNDYPSTLQSGQGASHRLIFTTPTGASEGSTITISFDTNFDTSSIIEDDVDIADDGTDLTTAADCTGSEQASVAIASDVVTITICSGDGGAIAATSQVQVEIGTFATASGTGTNLVTNPTNAGTYYVSIAGTFGDSGSIALPIGSDDSIAVSGGLPTASSGGGSPDDTPLDESSPTISDILVSEVTTSSAVISWTTSESADSAVDYGADDTFDLGTESSSSLTTSHSIALTGLDEGQEIYFQVRSSDESGNESTSSTETFSTLDETNPVISDIEVIDLSTTSARVTWTTDEAADSIVSYGETTAYEFSESESALETSHSVLLIDLIEGTEYHFQVLSADASSNQAFTEDDTFTTDSDEAPTNVSSLIVIDGDQQITLEWTNPGDDDLEGVRVLLCEGDYPLDENDTNCTVVLDELAEAVEISGLSNSTTYYVGVFAYDTAGQFASGALGEGTPSASGEELLSEEPEPEPDEEIPMGEETPDTGTGEPDDGDGDEDTDSSAGEVVTCGDDVCSDTESADSCPVDCASDEPTSLGAEVGDLDSDDVSYLVADDELELELADNDVIDVLPTSTLSVNISADNLLSDVESLTLTIGEQTYLLSLDEETDVLYSADVTTPDTSATYLVSIEVTYEDGSTENISSLLKVLSYGGVYQVIDGEEVSVSGATVTLYEIVDDELVVWDGSPYGQFNPATTNADGAFAWYVPNGLYAIQVQADGFELVQTDEFAVTNIIVNPSILMFASFEKEEPVIQEPESTEEPASEPAEEPEEEAPKSVFAIILESAIAEAVQESLQAIREIPGVEKAAEISVPALAITAGASVVVLSVAFDFLPFLQYLFTAPVLFFWRRKRKGFGIIYNAISKTPVDLAVVRLFSISAEEEAQGKRGRLVKSRVTDRGGRYFFLVPPGRYRMTVTKAGFDFPSEYLQEETVDGSFLDLYHGETIEVSASDAVITANVPMDPSQTQKYQAPKAVIWRKRLRLIQHVVAFMGVVAAIVFAIIRPTVFSIGMIALQVLLYFLAHRLAKPRKPISWGIVYHKDTGRPLSKVVARIFEPKYNKLLETQVTDSKGRYAFMLGPNEYYAVFQKTGFEPKEIDPIDFKDNQGPEDFSEDVELHPKNETPGEPASES